MAHLSSGELASVHRALVACLGAAAPSASSLSQWARNGTDLNETLRCVESIGAGRELVPLSKLPEALSKARPGEVWPSYMTLRRLEGKGELPAALTMPSKRRLYDVLVIAEQLRGAAPAVTTVGAVSEQSVPQSGAEPSPAGRISGPSDLGEARVRIERLEEKIDQVLDQIGVIAKTVGSALERLDGQQKMIIERLYNENAALRERLNSQKAGAQEGVRTYTGRSGDVYKV